LSYKTLFVFALLTGAAALLFSPHLLGFATFIGDSDRLNTLLNMRLFEVRSIQTLGWVPEWDENMFMGYGTAGLHWMLPSYDPLGYLTSLFLVNQLFWIEGIIAAGMIALAGWSAYLFIYDTVERTFPAFVGAFLYCFSVFSLHRVAQVDSAELSLVFIPAGLLVLRRVRPDNLPISFLALGAVMAFLATFGYLQEVSYVFLLFGVYALYRSIAIKGFDPCPLVLIAAAGSASVVIAAPRLISVIGDFAQLERKSGFQYTDFVEFARFIHEGLFGRFQEEREIIGNGLNLHEGLQLLGSTFAALLILVGLFRPRDAWQLVGGFLVGLVLSASITYISPQYGAFASRFVSIFTTASLSPPATALITNAAMLAAAAVLAAVLVIGLVLLLVLGFVLWLVVSDILVPVFVRVVLPIAALALLPVIFLPLWRIEPYLQLMPAVRGLARASRESVPLHRLEAVFSQLPTEPRGISIAAEFHELILAFRHITGEVREGTTFHRPDWQLGQSVPTVRQLMAQFRQLITECVARLRQLMAQFRQLITECVARLRQPIAKISRLVTEGRPGMAQYCDTAFRQILANANRRGGGFFVRPVLQFVRPILHRVLPHVHRDPDTGFHLIILGFVLAIVLIVEARRGLYVLFGQIDFTHSRLSIVALLPMATLTAVYLKELLPSQRLYRALGAGLVIASVGCALAISWIIKGSILEPAGWMVPYKLINISDNKFLPTEFLKTSIAIALFIGLMCLVIRFRKQRTVRHALVIGLGCVMVFEAFLYGWFKINGPHTHTFPIAFRANNYFSAPPCTLVPPTEPAVRALRQRLQADDFRSVLVADMIDFPAFTDPHISHFWNLRLLGGYSAGNLLRLAELPWPSEVHKHRAMRFSSLESLPLALLALVNVKYIIPLDRALYFNLPLTAADEASTVCPHKDMSPDQIQVIENPFPVTPRQFFTERIVPMDEVGRSLAPGDDPVKLSFVEGIKESRSFETAGQARATYLGDKILIDVDKSDGERFLVLNEMYSPYWRGYLDNIELPVLATNTVMRGLIVPAGATHIEMRYVPFLTSFAGRKTIFPGGPVVLLAILGGLLLLRDSLKQLGRRPWGFSRLLKSLARAWSERLQRRLREFFEIERVVQLRKKLLAPE
jgi:hypothetical protein